jgi:hypothetical protein
MLIGYALVGILCFAVMSALVFEPFWTHDQGY